jgi:hypothetical protein
LGSTSVPPEALLNKLLSRLVRATPARWYLPNVYRMQLIQHAIDTLSAGTYLELGVDQRQTFSVVRVGRKIGVDPIAPCPNVEAELKRPGAQYFATTSDECFERHAAEQLPLGVDVVFIDGLHTYDQTYRDVRNALSPASRRRDPRVWRPSRIGAGGGRRAELRRGAAHQRSRVERSLDGRWMEGDRRRAIQAPAGPALRSQLRSRSRDHLRGPRGARRTHSRWRKSTRLITTRSQPTRRSGLGSVGPAQLQAILRELRKTRMTTHSA